MLSLHVVALTTVLTLVGTLAVLLPQDHARAADDTITVRVHLDDNGSVVIQREYIEPWGWVTADAIRLYEPEDGEAFSYGSATLAVEFVPEFRRSLPPVAGFQTRSSTYLTPPRPPCEVVTYDDEDGNTITQELCRPGIRVAEVTCEWGFQVVLGPYDSITREVLDGMWAMTTVCPHGRLLRDGGLTNPPGVITIDDLRAMITAALTRVGETRSIEAIPVFGTEENPLRSETTYVDFRVMRGGDDTVVVTVQARGGGAQQIIELEETTTIAIYSLAQ